MEEKELKASRERPQSITNILNEDFYYKWDGIEHSIEKGKTKQEAYYLAEHCALHMARKHCTDKNLNYHKEGGKIVDKIMGKEFVDYDKLTIDQAKELCDKREISLKTDENKPKNRATLINDLKKSH